MRRLPLIVLALALLAGLAAPSPAPAAYQVGIAENQPGMFSDPLFTQLGVKRVRLVTAFDVLTRPGDDEHVRVRQYLETARALGIDVLVTFEHARGAAEVCRTDRRPPQCRLPSVAEYERNFRRFRETFPWVTTFAPWNEVNHFTQPTSRDPRRAAEFTNSAARVCPSCTLVVADILDQADSAKAKKLRFKATTRYVKAFRKALRVPRSICGVHNYSDTNRFRDTGTRAIIKALGCKRIWLTETGGIAAFGPFRFDLRRQLKATRHMFEAAARIKAIRRVYVYNFFGGVTPRFDAGLVAAGKPRPAFAEVRKRLKR
jgi:hypothetical protein